MEKTFKSRFNVGDKLNTVYKDKPEKAKIISVNIGSSPFSYIIRYSDGFHDKIEESDIR